jgi:transcriptional regulator with XRE-family HTH domain
MLSFLPKTPNEIQTQLKAKFKTRRKNLKLSQNELSLKADISLGSLKRFEQSGQISLESLLKIAFVLECLGDFSSICGAVEQFKNIDELIK